jgi:hypothetical protein
MNLLEKLKARFAGKEQPEHLRRGELGERAAKKFFAKIRLEISRGQFSFRAWRN